jgi:hypothetical protein
MNSERIVHKLRIRKVFPEQQKDINRICGTHIRLTVGPIALQRFINVTYDHLKNIYE